MGYSVVILVPYESSADRSEMERLILDAETKQYMVMWHDHSDVAGMFDLSKTFM
jgi:hypothetical protein